jgi:hypothetical protein
VIVGRTTITIARIIIAISFLLVAAILLGILK